jgi:hypothetical protein
LLDRVLSTIPAGCLYLFHFRHGLAPTKGIAEEMWEVMNILHTAGLAI